MRDLTSALLHDLTQSFPNIVMETPNDRFIPDLMLSSKDGETVYVEIAVTHESSVTKRESGHRIIELAVENENDLEVIKTCLLSESDERVEFLGFNVEPKKDDFSSRCSRKVCVFYLWHSGKSVIRPQTVAEFRKICSDENKQFHFSFVSCPGKLPYVEALERAHLLGLTVKNCYLCRYHAEPYISQLTEDHHPIFCKTFKETCPSNHAAECERYRPDKATFHVHRDDEIKDLPQEKNSFGHDLLVKWPVEGAEILDQPFETSPFLRSHGMVVFQDRNRSRENAS